MNMSLFAECMHPGALRKIQYFQARDISLLKMNTTLTCGIADNLSTMCLTTLIITIAVASLILVGFIIYCCYYRGYDSPRHVIRRQPYFEEIPMVNFPKTPRSRVNDL
ncbi:hypothetical protein NPIL_27381 [Nephila pilipes]|uniref:Uncharacterized protein n=1 Tax=Nephila pilipes TaxID=299642 RepID=A0A8X6P691_NEPPI|nr:hypothetical protein NPIL_27381 [Nephila pilipes]